MNCSVVIPVYRSEQTLDPLIERLGKVLPTIASVYEVILVNDGSPDNTWAVVERLSKQYPWVRGIDLMRNYGQHNALLCGIRQAHHEIIITMDDDLQHPPEEIPILISKLNEGYDVVYGIPKKMPHSWWRNLFSWTTKRAISYAMGIKTIKDISAFRAFRTHIRNAFSEYRGPEVLIDALFSWGTSRFSTVAVDEQPRVFGQSNYNFGTLARMALLVLTSYSTMPLRFANILGFAFMLFGFFILVYVLIIYFTAGSIPGFPFLASTFSIFSGVQLFALGVIGEYLARMFERQTGKLPYQILRSIDSTTNNPQA